MRDLGEQVADELGREPSIRRQIEHVIEASPIEVKPAKKRGRPKGKPAKAAKAKKTVAAELVAAAPPKKRGWPKGKPRGPKLPSAVKLQAALA